MATGNIGKNASQDHAVYKGSVMHARLRPLKDRAGHRFNYTVYSLLLDLDRLSSASKTRFFSRNRFNLLSFYDKDHGARTGESLRIYINRLLEQHLDTPPSRIMLLCYPRVLGWVFNPLSVYYCYDAQECLIAMVYEVRNTFGENHTYVAPLRAGEVQDGRVRQERNKRFYVSPFMDMDMRYHFRLNTPGEALTLRILETDEQGPLLAATFKGTRQSFTATTLLAAFMAVPFQTLKIVGGIHYEALKLWWKGAQYHRRPQKPKPLSYADDSRPVELADLSKSTALASRRIQHETAQRLAQ